MRISPYIKLLLATLFVFMCNISIAAAKTCIAAPDFGLGAVVDVRAKPSESDLALVIGDPPDKQIAPWIDSGIVVQGINENTPGLIAYVYGEWYPLGRAFDKLEPECDESPCVPTDPDELICEPSGIKLHTTVRTIDDTHKSRACKESNGYGLYGLIAFHDQNGKLHDPNAISNAATLPETRFRTFRMGPFTKVQQGNNTVSAFTLKSTQYHYVSPEGSVILQKDLNKDGVPAAKEGKLYFKIMDQAYDDNAGGYVVSIVRGAPLPRGFIEQVMTVFQTTIQEVQGVLFTSVVSNTAFIGAVRALLVLYVAVTGVLFLSGLMRIHHGEFTLRLLKLGFVATVISPDGWEFFRLYIYDFFNGMATSVANLIIQSTVYSPTGPMAFLSSIAIPENDNISLTIYDLIIRIITSTAVHTKIWSLLFTQCIYFIPVIYFAIITMLLAIFKGIMIYLLSILNLALLVIIGPIFVCMILFSITKPMFDDWLKQISATCMMLIFLAATMALMVTLVLGKVESLLFFETCWQSVIPWDTMDSAVKSGFRSIGFDVIFWYPTNFAQVSTSLTLVNCGGLFVVVIFFYAFLDKIPIIVDTLSAAAKGPWSTLYGYGVEQFNKSFVGKGIDKILAAPQAKIGAEYEYGVDYLTYKFSQKLGSLTDNETGKKALGFASKGIGEMVIKKVLRAPTMPGSMYRMTQSLEGIAQGAMGAQSIFSDNEEGHTLFDLGPLKDKPKKNNFSYNEHSYAEEIKEKHKKDKK